MFKISETKVEWVILKIGYTEAEIGTNPKDDFLISQPIHGGLPHLISRKDF